MESDEIKKGPFAHLRQLAGYHIKNRPVYTNLDFDSSMSEITIGSGIIGADVENMKNSVSDDDENS